MKKTISQIVSERILILDGAMGTMIQQYFRIIAWLFQFYIVYVVWEGAPILMQVEEKVRLKYTLFSSVLLILCPTVIQFVFSKLIAILN